MGGGRLRRRRPHTVRLVNLLPLRPERWTFITPVFRPESCYRAAQPLAGPGVKDSSPGEGPATGRGRSIPKHLGDADAANAGLAAWATIRLFARHGDAVARMSVGPTQFAAGVVQSAAMGLKLSEIDRVDEIDVPTFRRQ